MCIRAYGPSASEAVSSGTAEACAVVTANTAERMAFTTESSPPKTHSREFTAEGAESAENGRK
jgi:hypothetical protein